MRQGRLTVRWGFPAVQDGRLPVQRGRFPVRPGRDSTPDASRCTANLPPWPPRSGCRCGQAPGRIANLLVSAMSGRFGVRLAVGLVSQEVCDARQWRAGLLQQASGLVRLPPPGRPRAARPMGRGHPALRRPLPGILHWLRRKAQGCRHAAVPGGCTGPVYASRRSPGLCHTWHLSLRGAQSRGCHAAGAARTDEGNRRPELRAPGIGRFPVRLAAAPPSAAPQTFTPARQTFLAAPATSHGPAYRACTNPPARPRLDHRRPP